MAGSRSQLPVELTSFVGREREVAALRELVPRSRLVTLTGVGGSGKTRLALQVASEVELGFRDGAVLVELAPLSDEAFAAQTVVQALELAESGRRNPEAVLVGALRDSDLVLLLDNCEHVVRACARLAQVLLTGCPELRILATSREPLGAAGEVTFPVRPLPVPDADADLTAVEAGRFAAISLFADRAAAAQPGFALEDSNSRAVAAICRTLDGLPLALELAAAWARSMSADEILERLDNRFSLLARGPRTSEPRHQTLRATLDWSHELLTEPERILLRRLSVMAGDWRLEDAEAICADDTMARTEVVHVHARLSDRSMIVAELGPTGPTRYHFLETVRQYAAERLVEAGELETLQARHFEHFLEVAEAYYRARITEGSDASLPVVAAHRDNFRAALAWSEHADRNGCLRLTAALDDFWRMISAEEGWDWLQRTMPDAAKGSPLRLRALLTAGMLAAYVPAYAEGAGLLNEALSEAHRLDDRVTEAWAELWLGRLAFFGDRVPDALSHLEKALTGHTALRNPLGRVRSLALLGLLQALALDLHNEGEGKLMEALEAAHEIGDSWGEGYANLMLGIIAADAGDLARSAAHSRAALTASSLGPILGVPLQGLGRVAVETDPGRAMRLVGAGAGHFDRTSTLEPPFVRRRAEAVRDRAANLLGAEAAARLFEEGRRMSTDEAVQYALATARDPASRPGGLTPRETQVAVLVAKGATNREIAQALFISLRTAESHVEHICNRLGLNNRNRVAAWARENGLLEEVQIP